MINKGLFTSNSDEWETPQELFDELNDEFNFTLDPCATKENAKCNRYFTREDDGLTENWAWTLDYLPQGVFVNPPYGREIGRWVKKAYEESKKGIIVVCLLPARTDTSYFHNYIYPFCINLNRNEKVAWASGIIDGEGCIFIRKNRPTSSSKHRSIIHDLGLKVSMCDKETIYLLRNTFNCGHIQEEKKKRGWKNAWHWVCRAREAEKVIRQIYKYSVTKKHELFEAINFALLPSAKHGHGQVPQELLEKREEYYQKLKKLKNNKDNHAFVTLEIRFIKGRLKFSGMKNSTPFPSMIVIFRGNK